MIAKYKAGTLGGETFTLRLSNGGLKIAYNSGYTLSAEAKAAADAAIEGIKNGSIKVNP
jgi:basic membrane lipoprotein Med (substrate-binding protein (PBP1-ABC) superfamily)